MSSDGNTIRTPRGRAAPVYPVGSLRRLPGGSATSGEDMDFGRILEAQERRRQELHAAIHRAELLRQLDPTHAAERPATAPSEGRWRPRRVREPLRWLRALVWHRRVWPRA